MEKQKVRRLRGWATVSRAVAEAKRENKGESKRGRGRKERRRIPCHAPLETNRATLCPPFVSALLSILPFFTSAETLRLSGLVHRPILVSRGTLYIVPVFSFGLVDRKLGKPRERAPRAWRIFIRTAALVSLATVVNADCCIMNVPLHSAFIKTLRQLIGPGGCFAGRSCTLGWTASV